MSAPLPQLDASAAESTKCRARLQRAGGLALPCIGAGLGVGATLIGTAACWPSHGAAAMLLVPSIGASSVLLFLTPSSDFAKPRAVLLGNLIAAVVGILAFKIAPGAPYAVAGAVMGAALVMAALRATHPPSGGLAVTAALGGDEIARLGFWFVVTPVLVNTLLLLGLAAFWHLALARVSSPGLSPRA